MDPRISTVESDVAAIRASVEFIQTSYATKNDLIAVEHRVDLKIESSKNELSRQIDASKNDLERKLDAHRNELDLKIVQLRNHLTIEFHKLSVELRNWVLGTVIALLVVFGGLTATIFNIGKSAAQVQPPPAPQSQAR